MNNDETTARPVTIRPHAVADIERHAYYLEENATFEIAQRFRAAMMNAVDRIAFMPEAGAPREVQNALLSGLRMYVVPDFRNYLVFYLTAEGRFSRGAGYPKHFGRLRVRSAVMIEYRVKS